MVKNRLLSPLCSNDYLFRSESQFQNTLWILCLMKIGCFRLNINRKSYVALFWGAKHPFEWFSRKNTPKMPTYFLKCKWGRGRSIFFLKNYFWSILDRPKTNQNHLSPWKIPPLVTPYTPTPSEIRVKITPSEVRLSKI